MYRDCPTNPDDIVHYLNNHHGGLVNQVEPSVNQEVGPLVSAIVSDVVGTTENSLLNTADSILTSSLIQGAVNYFTGSESNTGGSSEGGGLLGGLGGLGGGGGLTDALGSISGLFSGKK